MREVRFLSPNKQVAGLTGRRYRSPLVKKYADKVFGLSNTPIHQATLAPEPEPEPQKKEPTPSFGEIEGGGGPGIGPGEGAVGGVESGSTFGEGSIGEELALENMNAAHVFGLPAVQGIKGGLSALLANLNASQVMQSALMPAIPAAMFSMFNRGIPTGIAAQGTADSIDAAVSGLDPAQAESQGYAALQANQRGNVNPNNPALMEPSPEMLTVSNILSEQNKEPKTLTALAIKNLNQHQIPGSTTNVGGHNVGSGTNLSAPTGRGDVGLGDIGDPGPGMGENDAADLGAALGSAGVGGGDGTVLCTSLYRQGIMCEEMYIADVNYAGLLDKAILDGYYAWASVVASWMDKSKVLTFILKKPILKWASHMSGSKNLFGRVAEFIGFPVCRAISKYSR